MEDIMRIRYQLGIWPFKLAYYRVYVTEIITMCSDISCKL
jgi:hypothetical protein